MTIKEARKLVDSRKKDDPNYAEAVELCIKDDETDKAVEGKIAGVDYV